MLAHPETASLAHQFIAETLAKQGIVRDQLTVHADPGLTKTPSRPDNSGGNPYSESLFRTMKYRPEFPDRRSCIQNSLAFGHSFSAWYNDQDRYSRLERSPSALVHFGLSQEVVALWQLVLVADSQAHPERFVANRQTQIIILTKLSNRPSQSC